MKREPSTMFLPHRWLAPAFAVACCTPVASAQGRMLWMHESQGSTGTLPSQERVLDLGVGADGAVYVAGHTASVTQTTDVDALVEKHDAYGALAWRQRFDLGGRESVTHLALDDDHDALFVSGTIGPASPSGLVSAWFALRLDPRTGAVLWERRHAVPGVLTGGEHDLALDAGGGIVLSGPWFADPDQSLATAVRFAPDGTRDWVSGTHVLGAFAMPYDVAAAPAGGTVHLIRTELDGCTTQVVKLSQDGRREWVRSSPHCLLHLRVDRTSDVFCVQGVATPTSGAFVEKRDAGGNLLWAVPHTAMFDAVDWISAIELDGAGGVYASSQDAQVARLDAQGNVLWSARAPWTHVLDAGSSYELAVAPDGDVCVLSRLTLGGETRASSILRWTSAGVFSWGQGLLASTPGANAQATRIATAPLASTVIAGTISSSATAITPNRIFAAALREQSRGFCYGDGSSGPCPCANDVAPDTASGCAPTATGGAGAELVDFGIASLGVDTLTLYARNLAPASTVIVAASSSAAAAQPFGDGLVCLSGPLHRLDTRTATHAYLYAPAAGHPSISVASAAVGDPIQAGATRFYQALVRGASSACGGAIGNWTNAIEVRWSP